MSALNQIARSPSGSMMRDDQLLSSFEIIPSQEYERGRPYQQTQLTAFRGSPPRLGAKLKEFRNWNGHWYAEDHIEEWVSRSPQALLPGRTIHVVASQNYAHLPEKIDLMLLDDRHQLHVLELKAEQVASNRGMPPARVQRQMNRYVDFLQREKQPFPASFANYYDKFSRRFLGSPHDLLTDLRQTFDEAFFSVPCTSLVLCPTFLTEGYDDRAVDYFRACHLQGGPPIRLIYYRFFCCPGLDRHFIEFWEIP
jgi:hypothetical protein